MQTKLYVGNLSDLVTVDALRRRFGQCGTVADVHLAVDRTSGRMRGYAFVTMASVADAQSAKSQLNGVMFEEKPLRVSDAGEDRENHSRSKDAEKPRVKI